MVSLSAGWARTACRNMAESTARASVFSALSTSLRWSYAADASKVFPAPVTIRRTLEEPSSCAFHRPLLCIVEGLGINDFLHVGDSRIGISIKLEVGLAVCDVHDLHQATNTVLRRFVMLSNVSRSRSIVPPGAKRGRIGPAQANLAIELLPLLTAFVHGLDVLSDTKRGFNDALAAFEIAAGDVAPVKNQDERTPVHSLLTAPLELHTSSQYLITEARSLAPGLRFQLTVARQMSPQDDEQFVQNVIALRDTKYPSGRVLFRPQHGIFNLSHVAIQNAVAVLLLPTDSVVRGSRGAAPEALRSLSDKICVEKTPVPRQLAQCLAAWRWAEIWSKGHRDACEAY
ncbi:hypothetical protein KCU83_g152, partial [Aureobasidium melanogenum]